MWNANGVENQTIMEKEFWGYNQKMNPKPQFQINQVFYRKVEEKNTQIFLERKMVSVLTCTEKNEENKNFFRRLNQSPEDKPRSRELRSSS